MRKYILAFLITIPILLLVWNISDSSEEPINTHKVSLEEGASNRSGLLQETDGIVPEENGDSRTDSQGNFDVHEMESAAEMTIEIINAVLLTQNIKEHLQNNDLSGFTFQESEKALCYYMGTAHNYPNMYVFAVCREAQNGDIVNERNIYIAKETGHLYAKDNGTLAELNADMPEGIQLPDITRNSAWNREPELVYSEDGTSSQIACGEDGEKVLDQMFDFAKKEEVPGDWGVIYYGECTYFYRRYHEVHLVEEHDTHVLTLKRYYIDAQNGNVYEEPYESFIGMDSDIALHFVGKIEIGEEKIAEADQNKLEKNSDIPNHATPFRDWEEIEKNHKILEYDICSDPRYDYENTFLAEYYKDDIEDTIELIKNIYTEEELRLWDENESKWFDMDYHLFDFNDDGLEDYLVCIYAVSWTGSGGNMVDILVQEEDGTFREILNITMRTINYEPPDNHEALTILDEKTDGYYAIVTPFYNRILRYDKEKGRYDFQDGG